MKNNNAWNQLYKLWFVIYVLFVNTFGKIVFKKEY